MNHATSAKASPSIRGKTVVVYVRNDLTRTPVVVSDCMLEERSGRFFLVGTSQPVQPGAREWTDGARRAIAWDSVDQYFLFESIDEYNDRVAKAPVQMPATLPGMPMVEFPQDESGFPQEPTGVYLQPETHLDVGDTVLAYSQSRWWRAEVVELNGDDAVTIHFPGWDSKWDVTVAKTELQVDLRDSFNAE